MISVLMLVVDDDSKHLFSLFRLVSGNFFLFLQDVSHMKKYNIESLGESRRGYFVFFDVHNE